MTRVGLLIPDWWLKNMVRIEVRIHNRVDQPLPCYAHGAEQDAGMDLISCEDTFLGPNEIKMIDTGINLEIPSGIVGEVRSRSGLASKGIVVNNAPGTIDPSYRGPVKVILRNQTMKDFPISKGDRIAQLVFVPYAMVLWSPVKELSDLQDSSRGEKGFGSTGLSSADLLGLGHLDVR